MKQFFLGFYAISFSAAVFMTGMFIGRWVQRLKTRRQQASGEIPRSSASAPGGQLERNEAVQKENQKQGGIT